MQGNPSSSASRESKKQILVKISNLFASFCTSEGNLWGEG